MIKIEEREVLDAEGNVVETVLEAHIPAVLIKLPVINRVLDNEFQTPWGLATAEVTYPDGEVERVQAMMWGASLDTGLFEEGMDIILRTQLEGKYKDNAVVQLPGTTRVNTDKFDFDLSAFQKEEAKAPPAKRPVRTRA